MRVKRGSNVGTVETDMTPMIDMTFQLIIFFMLAINFSEAEQDQRVRLPLSELAKPPEGAVVSPITIQLLSDGLVVMGSETTNLRGLDALLLREKQLLDRRKDAKVSDATIIIRGDREIKVGVVQEVIRACQQRGFEKFVLRAKQEELT
jgi:biopolymer transport protein ExbD